MIKFEEEKHLYHVDGVKVVSVTQALSAVGAWPSFSEIPSADRGYYMERGQKVHKAIYFICKFLKEQDQGAPKEFIDGHIKQWIQELDQEIRGYVESFNKFRTDKANGLAIVESEERVFSEKLKVAGTLDLFAAMLFETGPDAFIGDFKCGVHYYQYGYQSAGYLLLKLYPDLLSFNPTELRAVLNKYLPRRFGIHLKKTGAPPKLVEHTDPQDFIIFVEAIGNYHNLKREGKL